MVLERPAREAVAERESMGFDFLLAAPGRFDWPCGTCFWTRGVMSHRVVHGTVECFAGASRTSRHGRSIDASDLREAWRSLSTMGEGSIPVNHDHRLSDVACLVGIRIEGAYNFR